ncbi:MAG TPA: hypothetical protein DCX07_12310 [Phycisphaerales bacterium]|nr:hypothetical protein [Phycisphaerales bacterium]
MNFFTELGFENSRATEFYKALRHSGASSVDAFLEHRTEFIDIGKVAIARALLPSENPANLFAFEREGHNWYKYLWSRMNTTFEDLPQNRISILTYNYDRSCEQFLFTAMKNTHGKSDAECAEQMKRIPIVHLHGQLGPLPWQAEDGIPYAATEDTEFVRKAAKSIKIIHEDVEKDEGFLQAKELLGQAEVVYFIGFGYNSTNVERLKKTGFLERNLDIWGTSIGLGGRDRDYARKLYDEKIQLSNHPDIMSYFRNFRGLK